MKNVPFFPTRSRVKLGLGWFGLLVCFSAMTLCALAQGAEVSLEEGFAHPPDSAKPRTWWHWVSGNVSSEGITADLRAMKQIGLGGAQIFTVDQSAVKGPVVFLSPEWRKLVHQSLNEAADLHLEMAMEGCDGWSESGGRWVTPEQSMQKVVWSESNVSGGQKIPLVLPQPETNDHYYADIALFAFPTIAGDDEAAPAEVTNSAPGATPGTDVPSNKTTIRLKADASGPPVWVQYAYANAVTFGSLRLTTRGMPSSSKGELDVSNDGTAFQKVCNVQSNDCLSLPPTTAKFFRVVFDTKGKAATVDFADMTFGGPRISNITSRTGMHVQSGLSFEEAALSPGQMIDPKAIVDLTGKTEWNAPAGKWTLVRLGHTSTGAITHPSTSYGLECDKMSAVAVESHIQNLFGPVWQDSPQQVGTTLKYILLDSWEAGCENWTPLMRDEFKKRRGYDPWPWLPTLTGRVVLNPDATDRFLWDYRRTLADLVADNHYGTFQQVAHAHGMGLASEAPGIGAPTVADGLQCKGRCDIPMGEFWVGPPGSANIDDPREAASAAHIYGQNIAATESYTSVPQVAAWTNDPYSMKIEGDKEFCLGVNRFVFHRYAHQPWLDRFPGMSMGPWGINFERTNTWWNQASAWMSYLSRCQFLLQQGRFVADLLYFYGEGAPVNFQYSSLQPAVPPGYDYDACDAEILLNQMSVEDGQIVLNSGMRYRVLVLPNNDRMTLPALKKVASLVKQGAVVYGPRPNQSPSLAGYPESDEQLQALAREVWGNCDGSAVQEHAYGKGRIVWGKPLADVLGFPPDFGSNHPQTSYIHRTTPAAEIYFVANQIDSARELDCTFRVAGKVPELWHPDSGKMETPALYHDKDGRTSVPIHFDPSGSVFVIFRRPATGDSLVSVSRDGVPLEQAQRAQVTIEKAVYGAPNNAARSVDVRQTIQSIVNLGQTLITASNSLSATGDPAPLTVKSLSLTYTVNGKTKTSTVREGDSLELDPHPESIPIFNLVRRPDGKVTVESGEAGRFEAKTPSNASQAAVIPPLPQPLKVIGPWQIEFPPHRGAPGQAVFSSLISWTDSPVDGIKYFSGTATYRTDFNIPAEYLGSGRHAYLDLGEVKNLAEVSLNGKPLDILWKAPFRIDISPAAVAGLNHLAIQITNLWPNRLIGDAKLPKDQQITWASVSLYKADSPLLPSGLLGPVTVIPTAEATLSP